MKVSVILPAAGLGTRMGRPTPDKPGVMRKQFMLLDGVPVVLHTIRKFAACSLVTEIVLATRPEDLEMVNELIAMGSLPKPGTGSEGRRHPAAVRGERFAHAGG